MQQNTPEQRPEKKPPTESLSFQSLTEEMGEVWAAPPAEAPESNAFEPAGADTAPQGGTSFGSLADEEGHQFTPPPASGEYVRPQFSADVQDRINARVLSASAPKASPMWIQSVLIGAAACVIFFFFRSAPAFAGVRQILFYVLLVVSAGAIFWGGYGFSKGQTVLERRMNLVGMTLGILAALAAILARITAQ